MQNKTNTTQPMTYIDYVVGFFSTCTEYQNKNILQSNTLIQGRNNNINIIAYLRLQAAFIKQYTYIYVDMLTYDQKDVKKFSEKNNEK